jgi:hypothetical protein
MRESTLRFAGVVSGKMPIHAGRLPLGHAAPLQMAACLLMRGDIKKQSPHGDCGPHI